MTRTGKGLLLAAWIVLVAVLGGFVERELVVGTDLRLFMPSPRTAQERLVLEEIGEGLPPGSSAIIAIAEDRIAEQLERGLAGYVMISRHAVSAEGVAVIAAEVENQS